MSLSEIQALQILKDALAPAGPKLASSRVRFGIGDDGAVLRASSGDQVCTVDSCEEGVHFLFKWMKAADVAKKSLHSALSDVVAMGGKPAWIVCHLSLGPSVTSSWLREFAREQARCSRIVGAPVVGGNVSFSSATSVVTTVVGEVEPRSALLRSGARPGDEVWLVGSLGLARAGLLLLQDRGGRARGSGAAAAALRAFRSPESQFRVGPKLAGRAHCCIDISDGMRKDAAELALMSDVRLMVEADRLEEALDKELFVLAPRLGISALELALEGGEDYALLATGPAKKRLQECRVIGLVEPATRARKAGAFLVSGPNLLPLSGGFVHGRNRSTADRFR